MNTDKLIHIVIAAAFACTVMMPPAVAADDRPQAKNYEGRTLTDTNFLGADLKGANFRGATLNGVVFAQADLTGADFRKATFGRTGMGPTDFSLANLTDAKFSGARLETAVSFLYAVITGADFSGMDLLNARFGPGPHFNKAAHLPSRKSAATGSSIYVDNDAAGGSSCGATISNACKTISEGIARCDTLTKPCTVFVEFGKYILTGSIALKDQISLTGGCLDGQPSAFQSTITAPPGGVPALTANSVTSKVDGFILVGTPSTDPAQASIVVLVTNTGGVELSNSSVNSGTGKDAVAAEPGKTSNGGNGSGTAGGASTCRSNNAGGTGGTGWNVNATCRFQQVNYATKCHDDRCWVVSGIVAGTNGGAGQSTPGLGTSGSSDPCTWGKPGLATVPGGIGGNGSDTTTAATHSENRIGGFDPNGTWTPVAGNAGQPGNDGGGGGGGGAGQAKVKTKCLTMDCATNIYNGLAGGGGGAGGCGASGGQGGQMGSASFGIVLVNSTLKVGDKLKIVGAQGGRGGDGGPGAPGGSGGSGAPGCGSNCNDAAQSGAGGRGGNGGASGGGAGGNGGPSIGIVLVGNSQFDQTPTSIYTGTSGGPGKGGGPGAGKAPAGADGQTGLAQATYNSN